MRNGRRWRRASWPDGRDAAISERKSFGTVEGTCLPFQGATTTKHDTDDCVAGRCPCGAVRLEIGFPARWAGYDHRRAARIAHCAAYATYVGCWRKRVRVAEG